VRTNASRDQQLPGGVYSDAGQGNQLGRDCGDHRRELAVQIVDLGPQGLPATGQGSQHCLGRGRQISQRTRPQGRAGTDALAGIQLAQRDPDWLGCRDDDGVDLRTGLDPRFHRAPPGDTEHPDHLDLRVP